MQSKSLILSLYLIFSLSALSAWGAGESVVNEESDNSLQTSNIEGWEEEELENPWTYFGMGFESRNLGAAQQGGVPGQGKTGPAVVGRDGGQK